MLFIHPRKLSRRGILGINTRNRNYIAHYNNRRFFPLVDDKLQTKLLAREYGIETPTLRYVIRQQSELRSLSKHIATWQNFVLKPTKGSGGKGIVVISQHDNHQFTKPSGVTLTLDDLTRHMSNTLAGLYSLAGLPDHIIVEDMIECDDSLKDYSYEGVPDIRIIVFMGYPVMAMVRLATHASDGKANLHQGAVGVGLDIATGHCLNAVQFSRHIKHHPDNGINLGDLKVADWHHMLTIAARCHDMTGLGYIGADMVVDKHKGAQLLELNARPGLAIQIANNTGLLPRLKHIEQLKTRHASVEERVAYAQECFTQNNSDEPI